MKDKEIAIKVSDLKKAYDEGCEDVKATLKRMYPDVFEDKWEDVTEEITWKHEKFYGPGDKCYWLVGSHGQYFGILNVSSFGGGTFGVKLNNDYGRGNYRVEYVQSGFKIFKKL